MTPPAGHRWGRGALAIISLAPLAPLALVMGVELIVVGIAPGWGGWGVEGAPLLTLLQFVVLVYSVPASIAVVAWSMFAFFREHRGAFIVAGLPSAAFLLVLIAAVGGWW